MRFELWSGEELWLPVELVDWLDQTVIQEGVIPAMLLLCSHCPPAVANQFGLRDAHRIAVARLEWLKTHATAMPSPSESPADAV